MVKATTAESCKQRHAAYLLTVPGTHVCCHLLRVHRAKDASLSLRKRSLPLFFRNESLQQYVPEVMSQYLTQRGKELS